jgi:hypothetical protein
MAAPAGFQPSLRREAPPSHTGGEAVYHCLVESCHWVRQCTAQAAYKHVREKHPGWKATLRGRGAGDRKVSMARYYRATKEREQVGVIGYLTVKMP